MSKTNLHGLRVKLHKRALKSHFPLGRASKSSNFLTVTEAVFPREMTLCALTAEIERQGIGEKQPTQDSSNC